MGQCRGWPHQAYSMVQAVFWGKADIADVASDEEELGRYRGAQEELVKLYVEALGRFPDTVAAQDLTGRMAMKKGGFLYADVLKTLMYSKERFQKIAEGRQWLLKEEKEEVKVAPLSIHPCEQPMLLGCVGSHAGHYHAPTSVGHCHAPTSVMDDTTASSCTLAWCPLHPQAAPAESSSGDGTRLSACFLSPSHMDLTVPTSTRTSAPGLCAAHPLCST